MLTHATVPIPACPRTGDPIDACTCVESEPACRVSGLPVSECDACDDGCSVCPQCGEATDPSAPYAPFCNQHCRRWHGIDAAGDYAEARS